MAGTPFARVVRVHEHRKYAYHRCRGHGPAMHIPILWGNPFYRVALYLSYRQVICYAAIFFWQGVTCRKRSQDLLVSNRKAGGCKVVQPMHPICKTRPDQPLLCIVRSKRPNARFCMCAILHDARKIRIGVSPRTSLSLFSLLVAGEKGLHWEVRRDVNSR